MKPVPPFPQADALPVYAFAYLVLRPYYAVASRLRVEGIEHVPPSGGAIVVCNHTRGNDYFPLGMASPRQIYYMVKGEAFRFNPVLDWVLRAGGCFPVERGMGDTDALNMAVDIVRDGHLLGMFPEGHRSPDGKLQQGKTGATRIALQARVPVLPVGVIGAEAGYKNFPRFWNRKLVLVRFGEPFVLEGAATDRRAVVDGTRRIMQSIADLLPEEMRGVYATGAPVRGRRTASPGQP